MAKRTGIVKERTVSTLDYESNGPLRQAAQVLGLTIWAMRERIWNRDIPYVRFDDGRKICSLIPRTLGALSSGVRQPGEEITILF